MSYSTHTFLADIADKLYTQYGETIHELTILVPNQKAIQILQQRLAERISKPIWSPRICTLTNLIEQLSQLSIASPLQLVFELYQTVQILKPSQESFAQFYVWGEVLLQDFDSIDKGLVNPQQLFANLFNQKTLELNDSPLTESQKDAIRSFWKTFDQRLSKHQDSFLQFWQLLPAVYKHFVNRLLTQHIAYGGLAHRKAYQELRKDHLPFHISQLAVVGFHVLHPTEEHILALLQEKVPTDFYWDVDAYYMEDEQQEAGHYLRNYQKKPHFKASLQAPYPERIQSDPKALQIFAVASDTGQTQVVGNQLQALIQQQGPNFKPEETAIILANESLFLPLLHALPESIQSISTTLGYPLRNTAIYQLMEELLALQLTISQKDFPTGYLPTNLVLRILHHPYIRQTHETFHAHHCFKQHTAVYIKQGDLATIHPLYQVLFQPLQDPSEIVSYLREGLLKLDQYLIQLGKTLLTTEKEAIGQLYQQLGKIQQTNIKSSQLSLPDFIQLFKQVITPLQLDLGQDNLAGIQILRMWETNNLDFKYVFILGMNEGCFPATSQPSSFIPYNLRKGYGLPTADTFQASLDAYYFYRLLQRAQSIYITYSTQTIAGKSQEMSRYLWQLLYESNLPIKQQTVAMTPALHKARPIVIEKDESIQTALERFLVKSGQDTHRLTPSAINSYLTCSLQFYFRYIAQIKPKTHTLEENESILFGNLLHQAMEHLHSLLLDQLKGASIQKEDIQALKNQVNFAVQNTFNQALHQGETALAEWQGSHTILQAVISKLIHKILDIDQAYAPFSFIGLEVGRQEPLHLDFELNKYQVIGLRGIIDRVDLKQGIIRTVDYKTGAEEKQLESMDSLFDRHYTKRNRTALQLFFYAWLYKKAKAKPNEQVLPAMYNTRALFEPDFDPRLFIKTSEKEWAPITDISLYAASFEAGLKTVFDELFDLTVPFQQTENIQHCTYCPYQGICQRS